MDDDEPGFLEKLAELSDGLDSLFLSLASMTAVIHEINGLVNESTENANHINASGGNAGAKLANANRLAEKLQDPASRLEVLIGEYSQSVERIHPGMVYALREAKERNDDEHAVNFAAEVRTFMAATDETWVALKSFQDVLLKAGEAAKALRRVNKRIVASLQQQVDTASFFDQWKELL